MKPCEVSRKVLEVQPSAIHRISALAAETINEAFDRLDVCFGG